MSTMKTPTAPPDAGRVHGRVQDRYGALARQVNSADLDGQASAVSCCQPASSVAGSCCGPTSSVTVSYTHLTLPTSDLV